MIIQATKSLLDSNDLSFIESREVFDEILSGLSDEIATSSFLTALQAKKPTEDELLGGIVASRETIKTNLDFCLDNKNAIENINFSSSDDFLYIQLAQDIICSANNLAIARYDVSNSIDENKIFQILMKMGVNIQNEADYNSIEFENLNFSYIYLNNNLPYFKYAYKFNRVLQFDNVINVISKLLNPLKTKNIFIGVNDKNSVQYFANLALKLNYENSIIVSGGEKLPFLSLVGENCIAEAWKNKIFTYVLTADLLGFSQCDLKDIKANTFDENSEILVNILNNKIKDSRYDEVVMNAGLSLYITKFADSIIDGIELAKKTIDSNLALEKFEQIKKFYN